jgi:hypothetical protein
MPPSTNAWSLYINFVVQAVVGNTRMADAMMRQRGAEVREVAKWLRTGAPYSGVPEEITAGPTNRLRDERPPLWRGLVLPPQEAALLRTRGGLGFRIPPDPRVTFVSWTEDRDVACWFADPDSVISGAIAEQHSGSIGLVARLRSYNVNDILWMHEWVEIPVPDGSGRTFDLRQAAAMMPDVPDDQFAWNVATQSEVILDGARARALDAEEVEDCPSTEELDRRLIVPSLAIYYMGPPGSDDDDPDENPDGGESPARPANAHDVEYVGERKVSGQVREYVMMLPASKWGGKAYGFPKSADHRWLGDKPEPGAKGILVLGAKTEASIVDQARKRGKKV